MSSRKMEKFGRTSHFRDRKSKKSRSRSRSSSRVDKYRSNSPKNQKSSEYYIEKYRAIYKTKTQGTSKSGQEKKIKEKDESVIFFRKKYGGEIENLFTKHSDVFYLDKKEDKEAKGSNHLKNSEEKIKKKDHEENFKKEEKHKKIEGSRYEKKFKQEKKRKNEEKSKNERKAKNDGKLRKEEKFKNHEENNDKIRENSDPSTFFKINFYFLLQREKKRQESFGRKDGFKEKNPALSTRQ